MENVLIFSGSAHKTLAVEIATYLNLKVSPSTCDKFSNDNLDVRLGVSVRGKEVFIIQPLSPPASDNLLELIMMLDIARTSGAKSIHAVIPYFSYARSDKKDAPRISVAGRLVADLLVTAGAQHIIAMTLHSPQVHGFFNIHTDHLTAYSAFVNYFKTQDLSNCVVVSPDMGNAKRAAKLARSLGVPLAVAEKLRLSDEKVAITAILGDVAGKRILLVDDEIATAGTIVEMTRALKEKGAGAVTVVCTHGLFTGPAVDRLNNMPELEEIVTTNTVPLPPEQRPNGIKQLSIAHIFGEVIKRTVTGDSVGELFEFWPTS
ncbi:MAG: ribose-phosphate pyrophosphokinase [Anaerolineaceae bacterium]|nr:ribose-phosphate pyrophosphokinase [Anaerolineaceae bacterium]